MEEEHSSSMVNKDVQDRSLFLFAPFLSGPHCAAFFKAQLKQQGDDDVKGGGRVTRETPVLKPLHKFFDDPEQSYLCTAARIFSHSKVYVLLEDCHRPRPLEADTITNTNTPREGYAFDLKTGSFDKFASPKSIKPLGTVLSAHGQLYYIASPWDFPWIPEASFERYDPAHDKWDTLPSFPDYSYHLGRTYITGYAVCYGWILFSMLDMRSQTVQLFGYHDKKNEWHPVKGSTGFFGRAVVVGETLYAVALSHNLVIAFSFGKCGGEDGPIAYTLSPSLPLKGLKTADPPSPFCERTSVCLVHLGGRDFCFVETGQSEYLADIQHIGVTTFEIVDDGEEGNPMINTLHSTVYAVDTSDSETFDIDFGFAT